MSKKQSAKKEFRQRRVHLDFHTSGLIGGVGSKFDADEFAEMVKGAHIDSMTIFAVCHHGNSYYPSKVLPQHPSLKRDLLGEQIEALHRRDIECPVYISVAWNYLIANAHPEWRMIDKSGKSFQDAGAGFYNFLQFINNDYEQMLQEVTREVLQRYDVDGLFYDIVLVPEQNGGTYDEVSVAIREKFGWMEPKAENAARMDIYIRSEFARRMNSLIRKTNNHCSIFYNAAHHYEFLSEMSLREELRYQTHMEMESLPSGAWGYFHFPMMARLAQSLNIEGLGMTGKFQKSWGDFGGRKTLVALEFECFRSQALGFGNSVGDQLHPSGKICRSTYQLIGQVYEQTKAVEEFYAGSAAVPQVGILSPAGHKLAMEESMPSIDGAIHIFEELHYECQLLDDKADFGQYELLVLPDTVCVDKGTAARLKTYVGKGGKLLVSGKSGFDADGGWTLGFLNYSVVGDEPLYPTFLRYPKTMFAGREPMDEVMYEQGVKLDYSKDMQMLVERVVPYFNRTASHFCSHFHTPPDKLSKFPAVIGDERTIVFADPIFAAYRKNGNEIYRMLVQNAIQHLIGLPPFGCSLPMSVLQTVRRKGKDAVITLLRYIPMRKALSIDIIDERLPFDGLKFDIHTKKQPTAIAVFGSDGQLDINRKKDLCSVVLPQAQGRLLLTVKDVF